MTTEEMLSSIFTGMTNFNEQAIGKITSLEENVTKAMSAHYAVVHHPEMRFRIRDEFDYILSILNPTTKKSMVLVRGYAADGATIKKPQRCAEVYIYDKETDTFKELSGDYTVHCSDSRGREWLTILYIQTDYDLAGNIDGELVVSAYDCPLTETEILVHIGTDTRMQPNVDDLLTQIYARSLYVFSTNAQYGNYLWGLRVSSPILSLYVQKNLSILTGCGFDTPSLVELSIPNSTYVPRNSRGNRMALRKADITNAQVLNENCFEYSQLGIETNGKQHLNVQSIGERAFQNCTALQTVTMGENVQSIGGYAFYNCTALQTVTMGENVQSIGGSAFSNCTALQTVTMGENVQSIGSEAFRYCTALQTVTMGENVQSIGGYAFSNCTALQTVTMSARTSSMSNNSFSYCYNIEKIIVPVGYECLQNYFTAVNSNYCGFMKMNETTGKYNWECFKDVIANCRDLTEISPTTKGYWHVPSGVLNLINADTAFVAAAKAKGWYFST